MGVEMWVKVFSPDVQSVEIVQRSEKRKRRARLYYMRYVLVFIDDELRLLVLIALLQTTQTRYEKRGEHRVQLSQEEVGSYGSETAETVIVVEYGFGMGFGFCDCIIPRVSSLVFYEYTRMTSVHEPPKNLKLFYHETQSITAHRQDNTYNPSIYVPKTKSVSIFIQIINRKKEGHTSNSPGPSDPKTQ